MVPEAGFQQAALTQQPPAPLQYLGASTRDASEQLDEHASAEARARRWVVLVPSLMFKDEGLEPLIQPHLPGMRRDDCRDDDGRSQVQDRARVLVGRNDVIIHLNLHEDDTQMIDG